MPHFMSKFPTHEVVSFLCNHNSSRCASEVMWRTWARIRVLYHGEKVAKASHSSYGTAIADAQSPKSRTGADKKRTCLVFPNQHRLMSFLSHGEEYTLNTGRT